MAADYDFDAVVIGSGAGGLTAAVALAQAGERVLVLEQHYLPGGWCHSFELGGYKWSPGVHYLGEMGPGGRLRRIYEGLGVSRDLAFLELNPDGYDHVLVAGERFDYPKGKERLAERLKARFPGEAAGIGGYIETVDRISRELGDPARLRGLLDVLLLPFRAPALARWGLRSHAALLDAYVRDPLLRAILAAQAGDHGLPPSLAPAAVHASVTAHYFDGGYYPQGGGAALPRAFIRALRRAGGAIRVRAPVDRILVERRGFGGWGRRAVGVRLKDGTELRARRVVSNADPSVTFEKLVGPEHLSFGLRRKLARTRYSVSAVSLFLAVDADVRAAGLDSGNYWYYASPDIESIYRLGMTRESVSLEEVPGFFLTVTTLKDPGKRKRHGHHTIEAFTFVPYDAFREWAESRYGVRPEAYVALKADLKARMLKAVGRVLPGVEKHVVFADLGTPLTNVHYVAATRGNLYGTEKSRFQVGPWSYPFRTEVSDLFLCGASTIGHGILGATLSGVGAAAAILGCRSAELLGAGGPPLRVGSPHDAPAPACVPEPTAPSPPEAVLA